MGLIVDGIEPTSIIIDGNSNINVLNVDGTYYWGKPYPLTIQSDAGVTVAVSRTSSDYQKASLGTLTTGSLIYHGDVLSISYTVKSGYAFNSFTVNGTDYSNSPAVGWTVTGSVTIAASTRALAWHTVWSGSQAVFVSGSGKTKSNTLRVFSTSDKWNFVTAIKFRVTGTTYASKEKFSREGTSTSSAIEVIDTISSLRAIQNIDWDAYALHITARGVTFFPTGVIITQIELYY